MNSNTGWRRSVLVLLISLPGLVSCGGTADHGSATTSHQSAASGSEIAAIIGEGSITLAEVDAKAKAMSIEPFQALYEARTKALGILMAEQLYDAEATSRGVSRDELLAQEVQAKVEAVTDADLQSFYDQNKDRMGGREFEAMKGQIETFLVGRSQVEAESKFLVSLKEKTDVRIVLDPPRVDVQIAANDPSKGPADAPVLIVEYSDFQ